MPLAHLVNVLERHTAQTAGLCPTPRVRHVAGGQEWPTA